MNRRRFLGRLLGLFGGVTAACILAPSSRGDTSYATASIGYRAHVAELDEFRTFFNTPIPHHPQIPPPTLLPVAGPLASRVVYLS